MKAAIFIGFASLIFLAGCKNEDTRPESIRPVFYQVTGSSRSGDTLVSSGVVQAASEAKLSFKVGGEIGKVTVEMGDAVRRGSVLAQLDATDYQVQLERASASLKSAEAQLSAARSAYARIENLYVNDHVSLSDFEKSRLQVESAEGMLKSARSQWELASNQLEYTVLRAPFDGVVTAVMAHENEMAGAGFPVVLISAARQLEVKTTVPEKMIGQVSRGAKVTVNFHAFPDLSFHGQISEVSPGISNASVYPVIVRLTDNIGELLPGMTGTVLIPLQNGPNVSGKIIVPVDAVGHDQAGDFIFVASEGNEGDVLFAQKRPVTLGRLIADGYEIRQGLEPGEKVITAGLSFLYDGRKVKLLNEEE